MTSPTPDRRVLDRSQFADVFFTDGGFEVRAGNTSIRVAEAYDAWLIRFAHNECIRHPEDAWEMRQQNNQLADASNNRRIA